MQHCSPLEEGPLYRVNWVVPAAKISKSGIGFGGSGGAYAGGGKEDSYAYLPDEVVDARLHDELRDHPLLLIPVTERAALIDRMLAEQPAPNSDFQLGDYLRHGHLSHKNRAIFESLLASYQGDYLRVL